MVDVNKIPPLQREILEKFLIPLNPDVSIPCLLNMLNAKLSQMVTFKRIKLKETPKAKPTVINYYAINIIPSGGNKDLVINLIDEYLLTGFKAYVKLTDEEYRENEEKRLEEAAAQKYGKNKTQHNNFIEKNKPRNIKEELEEATPEGLYQECLTLQKAQIGSLFIKIPELGLFLESPTQPQTLFLNSLIKLYEGQASIKSTKGEAVTVSVSGISCNCLLYSDTSKLLKDKASVYLNKLFETGLARRSFVSYLPIKELFNNRDYEFELLIKEKAFEAAEKISKKIDSIFINIEKDSVFELSAEAFKVYHQYKVNNIDLYNDRLNTGDDILLKELRGRFWKTLRLAAIIAALEHPAEPVIKPQDMEYAIYQAELFAQDFEKFFATKPETDVEKLFKFFLQNEGNWFSRGELRKQGFVHPKYFKSWFDECIEYVKEMAANRGYTFAEEKQGLNGQKFRITKNKIGQELSPDTTPPELLERTM